MVLCVVFYFLFFLTAHDSLGSVFFCFFVFFFVPVLVTLYNTDSYITTKALLLDRYEVTTHEI